MRAKRRSFARTRAGWIITFADLMTLLFALFVLIFSMLSLDNSILQSISSGLSREKIPDGKRGSIPSEIRLAAELMADTQNVHQYEGRLEELLFPPELLPPAIDQDTLADNVKVESRKEGMAFVLGNHILFEPQTSRILPQGRVLLERLAPLFMELPGDVAISGHVEEASAPGLPDAYAVSQRHALAVLGVFLREHLAPNRFSISGYGMDKPLPDMGGRVEILLKNSQWQN